jgi:hypothetical protein
VGTGNSVPAEMRVEVNVYDVLPNLSTANKVLADWIGAGGAFHSAVVIYHGDFPREWAYGGTDQGTGVFSTPPLAMDGNPYKFRETIHMGETSLTHNEAPSLLSPPLNGLGVY